jgi:hypothetical protein
MASKLHQVQGDYTACTIHYDDPIPHNHQEGEEHAKRSSVSSSVIGLTERIVLNIVNGEVVCVHKGLSPTWMQCYVSYIVVLLPERQPCSYTFESTLSASR